MAKEGSKHLEDSIIPVEMENGHDKFYDGVNSMEERAPEAKPFQASQVSKNYWYSPAFLGTYSAAGFTMMSGIGGYALIAPVLSFINADIGPSENIAYVPLANVLLSAITLQIIGCLSDIFGRRWFFIIGSAIGLSAAIVGATAQSITQIIVCQALFGITKGFGLSFFWVISEIVPMRWRFLAVSGQYLYSFPGNPLAAKLALSFQYNTAVEWRGCFYFLIASNTVAMILWFFFYHPPTFKMLHRRKHAKEVALRFDWIGLVLYGGGLLLLILGLTWGGSIYPWRDSHVIGTIVGGAACFAALGLWEFFLPIPGVQPVLPLHLFKNVEFQACCWITGIGSFTYYGFTLVWPQAVRTLYEGLSRGRQSTLTTTLILCFVFGQFSGGVVGEYIGVRVGIVFTSVTAFPLLLAAGTDPQNLNLTLGLAATGCYLVGTIEGIALTASTFPIRSQDEIGVAGGFAGAVRQFLSSIGTAVFSTVLSNRLSSTIPHYVNSAVIAAGLPSSSVQALINALTSGAAPNSTTVPGYTARIDLVARESWKIAHSQAYRTIFFVSGGVSATALFLCWFVPAVDPAKEDLVAGHLHNAKDEKRLEEEK